MRWKVSELDISTSQVFWKFSTVSSCSSCSLRLKIDDEGVDGLKMRNTRCDSLDENYTWCHVINVDGEAGKPNIASPFTNNFWHGCHRHENNNAIMTTLCVI